MKCYLKERRMENYLNQSQLAELSGIGRSHINRIEKGHITPTLEIAFRLAKTLNCKIEDLFSPE
jgi:DNA-binding XRE family transcriptional regulator